MLGVTSTDAAAGNSILLGPGGAPAAAAGGKGAIGLAGAGGAGGQPSGTGAGGIPGIGIIGMTLVIQHNNTEYHLLGTRNTELVQEHKVRNS